MADDPGTQSPDGGTPKERADHLKAIDKERRERVTKLGVALVLVVLFIVFVIQNSLPVPVKFLFLKFDARLIWVFLVCGLLGGFVGYMLGRPSKNERRIIKDVQDRSGS